MALIADCNITTPIVDGASWIDASTLNAPEIVNSLGETVDAMHDRAMISAVSDGAQLCIQTIDGVNEENNILMSKYQRFSSVVMGHTFGTDWSEWVKIG